MSEVISVATALRRVAAIKGRIAALTARMVAGNVYKEDDPPAFGFSDSYVARQNAVTEMLSLQTLISLSNAVTRMPAGRSVGEVVRQLAEMKSEIDLLKKIPVRVRNTSEEKVTSQEYDDNTERYRNVTSTVKWTCEMTESKRAEMLDDLQARFTALNAELEACNHETKIKL